MSIILDIVVRHLSHKASMTRGIFEDSPHVHPLSFLSWVHGGGEASSAAYVLWCYVGCHGLRAVIQAHSSYQSLGAVPCRGVHCNVVFKLHSVRMVYRSQQWLRDHYDNDNEDGDESHYDSIHFMQRLNGLCQECRFIERREFTEEPWWRITFHSPDCRCIECQFCPYVLI
jgi:hypothetical protein